MATYTQYKGSPDVFDETGRYIPESEAKTIPNFFSQVKSLDQTRPDIKTEADFKALAGTNITQPQASQQTGLSKVPTQSVGPQGEPIFDVFQGQEHIADPNDPRLKGIDIAGLPGGQAPTGFKSKFETAFNKADAELGEDGKDVSDTKGVSLVNDYIKPGQSDQTSLFVKNDEFLKNITKTFQDYINPANQRTSLRDEYTKMLKDTGIQQIDTELMDMKRVIEGTEDDLRTEITKAGGFATESQVQALTNARNKQLIKNYNQLLETRNSKEKYLQTALQLEQADRESADQRFNTMFNMGTQIFQIQQQMQNNARTQMQWLASNIGFDGLYKATGGDPYYTSLIESTLGLPQGGLLSASNQAALAKTQAEEARKLDLDVKKAQLSKTLADIPTEEERRLELDEKRLGLKLKGEQIKTEQAQRAKTLTEINKINQELTDTAGVDQKTLDKIQSSPEYKTINTVLPTIQALKAYKDAIKQYGTTETISGTGSGTLSGSFGNALATWKTLAGLGALSGADFELAENAIPTTGFFKRSSTSQAKLDTSIKNAIAQAENLTRRLEQNYPKASQLLRTQLDDMKVTAYPEKFVRGDDGLVYEIK